MLKIYDTLEWDRASTTAWMTSSLKHETRLCFKPEPVGVFPYSLIWEDSLGPETKTDSVAFAEGKPAQIGQKKKKKSFQTQQK